MPVINAGFDLLDQIEQDGSQTLGEHDHDATQGRDLDQYGVLGRIWAINSKDGSRKAHDGRLYGNINAPFSAVTEIWFVYQFAGYKALESHTLSIMLESMLISDPRLGHLPAPLSALVLHFGESGSTMKPCEAAFVGQSDDPAVEVPSVNVFCSPSAYRKTKALYDRLGGSVKIWPLYFTEDDIDAQSLLALMAVDETGSMPLYMHVVMTILSDLGNTYTFTRFLSAIKQAEFDPYQRRSLDLRLTLLQTFLCVKAGKQMYSMKTKNPISQPEEKFSAGGLTIVDLTDPFISPGTACSLFEIVLKLFNRADIGIGKVVVLDEAHKYLSEVGKTQTEGSKRLTERMVSFTRQQRHLAMRIVISTLLDLCSMIICHRFYSTGWWSHLGKHVATDLGEETFDKLVTLKTGHCLIFSPTALVARDESPIAQSIEKMSLIDFATEHSEDNWSITLKDAAIADGVKYSGARKSGRPVSWDTGPTADSPAVGWGQSSNDKDTWGSIRGADDAGINRHELKAQEPFSTSSSDDVSASDRASRPISQEVICLTTSESGLVTPADSLKVPTFSNAGPTSNPPLEKEKTDEKDAPGDKLRKTEHLGRGYLSVKTRRRVTVDGGRSLLATQSESTE
ncbi:hypothetical protein QFC19_004216 [Naganishia cerealis]|uniref:Uncharacterized protein n=1 Tax=Naganishia cerealis TaxID=610337 RepID=A0ACC2VX02_9TREE|nr:hypothetical protein QFC19_004216 [Naganishia cerealis]